MRGGWRSLAVIRLAEIDSTQNAARALADAGAPEGTVVWAEHQTRGRGRLGRSWADEPGSALLISIILRPGSPLSHFPQISLLTGVAVAEAIGEESGLPVTLVWPNDVFVHGRKAAGILAESFASGDSGPVIILGIGVNVNQMRFPDDLATRATSLALEAGHPFDRERLLKILLERLEDWYRRWGAEGFAPVREAWRQGPGTLGQRVAVEEGIGGIAVDVAEDGALVVRTDTGAVVRRVAGVIREGEGGSDAPGH